MLAAVLVCALAAASDPVRVDDAAGFRAALAAAGPGTRILLAPGTYAGGFHRAGLRGTADAPVLIAALDPARPPLFQGGGAGLHLSAPAHVELRALAFAGQTGNGLNVDDGGAARDPALPAAHLVLRELVVRDVGPEGNCDGIKLSGVDDVVIAGCTVERWGSNGSAVDLVGCRRVRVERCTFRGGADRPGASGVQAKGGSCDVAIRTSRFEHAGSRAVNAGGSTGLEYFRPPLERWEGPRWEARAVTVEGCTFVGGDAALAFVGCDGCGARWNTLYAPRRWAVRILQENRAEGFVPARAGAFEDNLIVFRSQGWSEGGFNVGPGTEPASFRFARNVWLCEDAPERTRALVRTPAPESGGRHGVDPGFVDAAAGDFALRPGSPAAGAGASAFEERGG